jgi:ectoine hydroxylase-related dioxygenase (phytanoyl-CoA dioxygenase family)
VVPTNELRTFKENNLEHLEAQFKETGATFVKIPMALQKGQVSFHHCRAIHGSDVNRGSFPRLSLAIHMQDGGNRFRVYRNEHGIPWPLVND